MSSANNERESIGALTDANHASVQATLNKVKMAQTLLISQSQADLKGKVLISIKPKVFNQRHLGLAKIQCMTIDVLNQTIAQASKNNGEALRMNGARIDALIDESTQKIITSSLPNDYEMTLSNPEAEILLLNVTYEHFNQVLQISAEDNNQRLRPVLKDFIGVKYGDSTTPMVRLGFENDYAALRAAHRFPARLNEAGTKRIYAVAANSFGNGRRLHKFAGKGPSGYKVGYEALKRSVKALFEKITISVCYILFTNH